MNSPITLHMDRSSSPCGLHLERRDGTRATIDEAIAEGFVITPNDAPAMLTLAQSHIERKEACHL